MRRKPGTGTIESRLRNGIVTYFARLPTIDRASVGCYASRHEAEAALDEGLKLLAAGELRQSKLLGAYGLDVIDRRELEGIRNVADERRRWRSYVLPWECASWHVDAVRRRHVAEWARGLRGKNLAGQTMANAVNLLRAVFRSAIDDELAEVNPCQDFTIKRQGRTVEASTWLTLEELAGLIYSADVEGGHLIAFAAGTGLRQGELRALLARDVHLDGATPHIDVRYGSPGKPTKSGKIRRVPLFGLARAAAASWALRRTTAGQQGPEYYWSTSTGCVRQKGHVTGRDLATWRAWLQAAGITRTVRWHDLRHTCATLLLRGDLSSGHKWRLEDVKDLLGHSSLSVTERYAQACGALSEDAARRSQTEATKPTGDSPSPLNSSRLRDLNSRPTVYESGGIPSRDEALRSAVGAATALLTRSDSCGDVPRRVVDAAAELVEAIEACCISSAPRSVGR